ncbi:MAG: hypothetical protein ABJA02_04065 [Acidobacteriota bacterium]
MKKTFWRSGRKVVFTSVITGFPTGQCDTINAGAIELVAPVRHRACANVDEAPFQKVPR